MKYLYMSFLLALVYSCSDSGDNSDYSEMLKKDFNQEIKWDVDSLALMRASWEKTDLGEHVGDYPKRFLCGISDDYVFYQSCCM